MEKVKGIVKSKTSGSYPFYFVEGCDGHNYAFDSDLANYRIGQEVELTIKKYSTRAEVVAVKIAERR